MINQVSGVGVVVVPYAGVAVVVSRKGVFLYRCVWIGVSERAQSLDDCQDDVTRYYRARP